MATAATITAPTGASIAALMVEQVYNTQFGVAQDRLTRSDKLTDDALNSILVAPQMSKVDIIGSLNIPPAPTIDGFSAAEMTALYQSTSDGIKALLANSLTSFLTNYFPLGNEMAAARAWVEKAITNGGTGLNAAVEAQIWERDRSRLLSDAARATDELMAVWAARGYPIPPGTLIDGVSKIDQSARNKIAQASRDVAIKQAEIELENTRFAIDKALQLRLAAIQAANEYIRTIALGPQLGAQVATSIIEAKAKLAQVLTSFFQAKISALELPVRIAIADASLNTEVKKSNLNAQVSLIQARVSTIEAAARATGTQASSALNALSANSNFSGSEQV